MGDVVEPQLQGDLVKAGDLVFTNFFGEKNHFGIILEVNLSYPWKPHYRVFLTNGEERWFNRDHFLSEYEL